ncbi:MAG: GNAT family N-acetyltransferase [Bilifractor sp.]
MNQNVQFRNASLEDASRLLEIYRYYVENTAITFEWTVPSLEEFQRRMKHTMEKFPYIVAVQDEKIVGYSYVGPFVGREAYDWSVETTIYLDAAIRHHGVGKQLYSVMEMILKRMHILNMNACIGYPKKDDAHLTRNSACFHEHLGFRMVGKFHDSGYKFDTWYDMVWMEKMIGEHTVNPAPVLNYHDIEGSLIGEILER